MHMQSMSRIARFAVIGVAMRSLRWSMNCGRKDMGKSEASIAVGEGEYPVPWPTQ
jgi:hypothetical protein